MKLLDVSPIFEMANLPPRMPGLSAGMIYVSTKCASHGCRIKYYSNFNLKSEYLEISISDIEIVDNSTKMKNSEMKEVLMFATKNSSKLLEFWYSGHDWVHDTINEFLLGMKLTSEDIIKSREIKFKYNSNQFNLPSSFQDIEID